jgi:Transposase DDE domain
MLGFFLGNTLSREIVMENTPRLYDTLVLVLSQHAQWVDQRHLKTLAWMRVGLIQSSWISLSAWAPSVVSRAQYAQSTVRRFRRWLDNDKIEVGSLYGPLMQQALAEWGEHVLYIALDTSMLWNTYCVARISVIYRGRAVPLVWCVLEHGSASVSYDTYKALLDRAALLLPGHCKVVFLADRGFADTELMCHLHRLGWHFRIRIKSSFWLYRRGRPRCKVERLAGARGHACFWPRVFITEKRYGPVHLAVARPQQGNDVWYVLSDEPTDVPTLEEYGLRFDIEENFLDDKSNGFQLESSLLRSAPALTRLCLVLAMTTLYLVAQGVEVVKQGKRRWVDPHWFRGQSYLKIGWNWVKLALSRGMDLITTMHLSSDCDPEPAMASKRQYQHYCQTRFAFECQDAA